jgi:WD40 repeat protein
MTPQLGLVWLASLIPSAEPRLDPAGDPLPLGAIARFGTIRLRHTNSIDGLAFSRASAEWPSGLLASVGENKSVRLWDPTTGREVQRLLGHRSFLTRVVFTPDGRGVVSGARDGTVILWDVATGEEVRRFLGHPAAIEALAIAPDGKTLFACADEGKGIQRWNVQTGRQERPFAVGSGARALALSPDGKTLAVQTEPGGIVLLDSATGRALLGTEWKGSSPSSYCLAYSSAGGLLAAIGEAGVDLYDTAGKRVGTRLWPEERIRALAFSPNGKLLAGAAEGSIGLWDVSSGKQLHRLKTRPGQTVRQLAFSPDGVLASGGWDHDIQLWVPTTGKEKVFGEGHASSVEQIGFSPEGDRIATVGFDTAVRVWDARTARPKQTLPGLTRRPYAATALFPDGASVLVAASKEIVRYDLDMDRDLKRYPKLGDVQALAISADGALFAQGNADGQFAVTEVASGRRLWDFQPESGQRGPWCYLAFSPDGRTLAASFLETGIHFFDLRTGTERFRVEQPEKTVRLKFSLDGRCLAAPGEGGVVLWETATGRRRALLLAPGGTFLCADLSPCGRYLAAGRRDGIWFWDLATGSQCLRLTGHDSYVVALAFSPDGRTLLSGSADSTALLWDLPSFGLPNRLRVKPRTAAELDALWTELRSADAGVGHAALWGLAESGAAGAALVRSRIRPAAAADPVVVKRLLSELDDDSFEVRERAARELAKLGKQAVPLLQRTLQAGPSPEVRRRIAEVLAELSRTRPTGDDLAALRTLEALERMGTDEAKAVLADLAKGAPDAELTRLAQASLERLGRR